MSSSSKFDPFSDLPHLTSGLSVSSQNLDSRPTMGSSPMTNSRPAMSSSPMTSMAGQEGSRPAPNGFKPTIDLNLNLNKNPNVTKPANTKQMGPNYSRSFFDQSNNPMNMGGVNPGFGGIKPRVAESAFDDLLGKLTINNGIIEGKTKPLT